MARIRVITNIVFKIKYTILNEEIDPLASPMLDIYAHDSLVSSHPLTIISNDDAPDFMTLELQTTSLPISFTTSMRIGGETFDSPIVYDRSIYTLSDSDNGLPFDHRLTYLTK